MANTQPPLPAEIDVTKVPADNRYGQNGYSGPSSVTPGQRQPSGSLKATDDDVVSQVRALDGFIDQQRKIDPAQRVPTAHGMRDVNTSPTKIAGKLSA